MRGPHFHSMHMLERPTDKRMRAAERQRKARRLRKVGRVVYQIEADEHGLADALILSARLTPDEALRRALVERELTLVIADFVERWIKHRHA